MTSLVKSAYQDSAINKMQTESTPLVKDEGGKTAKVVMRIAIGIFAICGLSAIIFSQSCPESKRYYRPVCFVLAGLAASGLAVIACNVISFAISIDEASSRRNSIGFDPEFGI
ncbi:MAG: hypothetical protein WCT85_02715 [Parachlamydiales bacterium]|jgi:hypothetical protein